MEFRSFETPFVFKIRRTDKKNYFHSFAAKNGCYKDAKARINKMQRIFFSVLVPLWLKFFFVKKVVVLLLK